MLNKAKIKITAQDVEEIDIADDNLEQFLEDNLPKLAYFPDPSSRIDKLIASEKQPDENDKKIIDKTSKYLLEIINKLKRKEDCTNNFDKLQEFEKQCNLMNSDHAKAKALYCKMLFFT